MRDGGDGASGVGGLRQLKGKGRAGGEGREDDEPGDDPWKLVFADGKDLHFVPPAEKRFWQRVGTDGL